MQMGLRGISTMRKPELVATLQAARSGGEAPAGVTVRAPKSAAFAASAAQAEEVGKPAEVAEVKADDAEKFRKSQASENLWNGPTSSALSVPAAASRPRRPARMPRTYGRCERFG